MSYTSTCNTSAGLRQISGFADEQRYPRTTRSQQPRSISTRSISEIHLQTVPSDLIPISSLSDHGDAVI